MNRLTIVWINWRSILWFHLSMIVAASVVLAVVLIKADSSGSGR